MECSAFEDQSFEMNQLHDTMVNATNQLFGDSSAIEVEDNSYYNNVKYSVRSPNTISPNSRQFDNFFQTTSTTRSNSNSNSASKSSKRKS